jgi:hypothetical protein
LPDFPIRKLLTLTEEIRHDGGPAPDIPRLRGAAIAVVANPYAGGSSPTSSPGWRTSNRSASR